MSDEVLVAIIAGIGAAISAIAVALSAVAVARINATKTDVGQAREQAAQANVAAVEARRLSLPTGNGYAEESRQAWARIEAGQQRNNDLIIQHLQDHVRRDLLRDPNDGGT